MKTTIFEHLMAKAREYSLKNCVEVVEYGMNDNMIYVIVGDDLKKSIGVTLNSKEESYVKTLKGDSVEEIFKYAKEFNPLQRAFALATINALGQHAQDKELEFEEDLRELLTKKVLEFSGEDDEVTFVGNLKPVVMKLAQNNRKPVVFCRNKEHYSDVVYSDIFEYEMIQKESVAVITGASLIGSTIDALIKLSPKNSPRILAGFSAAAHPSWFKGTGVTHIASLSIGLDFRESLLKGEWEKVFDHKAYFVEV